MIAAIITILLIALACVALAAALVIFIPFGLTADFTVSSGKRYGTIVLHWLHPRVVRVIFDLQDRLATLFVLGWSWPLATAPEAESLRAEEPAPAERATPAEKQSGLLDRFEKSDRSESKKPASDEASPPQKKQGSRLDRWSFLPGKLKKTAAIIFDRGLTRTTIRWLRRDGHLLLHLVRFHHLRLEVKGGAADPAQTGKLYGWYIAFCGIAKRHRSRIDVRFEPWFSGELLEADCSIGVRLSLARFFCAGVIIIATFPWLAAWRTWRKLKKIEGMTMPLTRDAAA